MNAATGKKCKTCDGCKRLYRLTNFKYYSDKRYYCVVKKKQTQAESGCDRWRKRNLECDLSERRFEESADDLEFIFNYFIERGETDLSKD